MLLVVTYRDVAGLSVSLRLDLHVPQVQDGGHDLVDACLVAVFETCQEHTAHKISPC